MIPKFDDTYNLHFTISPEQKTQMLAEYSGIYNKFEPFCKWMNSEDVKVEDKKPYEQTFINAMRSLSFYNSLMLRCGIQRDEIQEYEKIPF